jgi:diguanylate cyclase (GGDEF)-like protein
MVRHDARLAPACAALGSSILWLIAAPATADPVSWLVTGTVLAAAVAAAALAAATAQRVARSRPWWLLAAACSAWAVGAAFWAADAAAVRIDLPAASLADVFYLAFYPLAAAALVTMPGAPTTRPRRGVLLIDGLVAASALLAASWSLVVAPSLGGAGPSRFAEGVATAYPFADVLLLGLLASLGAAWYEVDRRVAAFMGGGGALLCGADAVYALVVNAGGSTLGGVVNVGYVAAFGLLGAAAVAARRPARPSTPAASRGAWVTQTPLILLVPALVAAAADLIDVHTLSAGVAIPLVVALGLVLVRQTIVVRENVALSQGLERLVTQKTAALADLAYRDELTGLANRRRLLDDLAAALVQTGGGSLWLAVMDLDGFKLLNDSLGHSAGDEALRLSAARLRAAATDTERVYRLGSDEFAVLMPSGPADTALQAGARYVEALFPALNVGDHRVHLPSNAGLAPVAASPLETLRAADLALTAAKAGDSDPVRLFDEAMASTATERLGLESDLRRAIETDGLHVVYQPVFDLRTGRPLGAEALVRWTHPERGPVPPDVFIPVAECSDLIIPLGSFVMNEAVRHAAEWRGLTGQPFSIWVNLSVRQLERAHAAEALIALLAAHGLPARALVLEVTEGLFMAPDGVGAATLHRLRQHGVRVAIDDFGTGYSSLSYLDRLPVDILKMDRHFVAALDDISRDATTTRGVIALASSLRLALVAEGIETEAQLEALKDAGCNLGQGYLLQRPSDAATIRNLLGIGTSESSPLTILTY